MSPDRTVTKRRPAGRLFLLLLFACGSLASAQFPSISLDPILDPSITACLEALDPQACVTDLLPNQENPDVTPEDQGFIDQVEALTAGDLFGADLPFLLDAASSVPLIHLGHAGAYNDCQAAGDLDRCSQTWVTSRPALPDAHGAEASAAIAAAWETFNRNMRDELHEALNTGDPCYAPQPSCIGAAFGIAQPVPVPLPECVVRKLSTAYPRAFARHYTTYVADVLEALATHLPNSVVYGFDLDGAGGPTNPIKGSLLAPLFSPDAALEFDPSSLPISPELLASTDISALSAELRAQIYYHEAYFAQFGLFINAPVLPGEVTNHGPGVTTWEAAKRDFGPGSATDQEFKGYAFLYQLQAPYQNHIFGKASLTLFDWYKPGIQVRCIEGLKVPGLTLPVPVPGYFPVFEDRTIGVGEGSFIPATDGGLVVFPEILGW